MSIQPKLESPDRPWEARISNDAICEATGREWDAWFALLDAAEAHKLPHAEIVTYLQGGKFLPQPEWWGQMIAVAYEQRIGRREPGQNCNGEYNATASRTLTGSMDGALAAWRSLVDGALDFDGVVLTNEPTVSETSKWRYWRASLADGSKVNVNISVKGEGKTLLQVEHRNVGSAAVASTWKAFWKAYVGRL